MRIGKLLLLMGLAVTVGSSTAKAGSIHIHWGAFSGCSTILGVNSEICKVPNVPGSMATAAVVLTIAPGDGTVSGYEVSLLWDQLTPSANELNLKNASNVQTPPNGFAVPGVGVPGAFTESPTSGRQEDTVAAVCLFCSGGALNPGGLGTTVTIAFIAFSTTANNVKSTGGDIAASLGGPGDGLKTLLGMPNPAVVLLPVSRLAATPEPGTAALLALGLVGLALAGRHRRDG